MSISVQGLSTFNYIKGIILVLCATLCWALASPIAKLMIAANINVLSVLVIRNLFVVLVLGSWIIFIKKENIIKSFNERPNFYLVTAFCSIMCNTGGYAMSLVYLSTAQAIILHYTFPLFTTMAALYVTREKPSVREYIAAVMIIIGVYLGVAAKCTGNLSQISIIGVFWGIVSVSGMTLLVLLTRKKAKDVGVDQVKLLFFANLFGGSGIFVLKSIFYGWDDIVNLNLFYMNITIAQAVFSTLLAYLFFYSSFNYLPAPFVSILTTFETVVVLFTSFVLLGIVPSIFEVLGSIIIILAIVYSSLSRERLE